MHESIRSLRTFFIVIGILAMVVGLVQLFGRSPEVGVISMFFGLLYLLAGIQLRSVLVRAFWCIQFLVILSLIGSVLSVPLVARLEPVLLIVPVLSILLNLYIQRSAYRLAIAERAAASLSPPGRGHAVLGIVVPIGLLLMIVTAVAIVLVVVSSPPPPPRFPVAGLEREDDFWQGYDLALKVDAPAKVEKPSGPARRGAKGGKRTGRAVPSQDGGQETVRADAVVEVMKKSFRSLSGCLREEAARLPQASTLVLEFRILGNGTVASVTVNGEADSQAAACALARMRAVQFPSFNGPPTRATVKLTPR